MCPGSERGPACMWNTSPPASTVKIFPGILLSGRLMTGSGMKGCHDPHSGPVRLPSRLVFYLGNYTGGAFSARWNGNAIIVEETRGGNFNGTPRIISPGPEHWAQFWKEIDDTGVWAWDEVYTNPHGCCGVTYWQLVLETGTRSVSCSGEDRFPGGESPELTPGFRALVCAIKTLCGNAT